MKTSKNNLLFILPTLALSKITGFLARIYIPKFIRPLVYKIFSKKYGVDLEEIEYPLESYRNLLSFFIRTLKKEKRPIDPHPYSLVSPVDGEIIALGPVSEAPHLEIKGARFTVPELFGEIFPYKIKNPYFITIYLCPGDYHRIHAPISGMVTKWWFIKGRLLPVNKPTITRFEKVFVGNKRIISLWENMDLGISIYMVAVGALNVGAIKTLWDKEKKAEKHPGKLIQNDTPRLFQKGEEAARFELGSTIVLIFENMAFDRSIKQGVKVKVGQKLGLFSVPK